MYKYAEIGVYIIIKKRRRKIIDIKGTFPNFPQISNVFCIQFSR